MIVVCKADIYLREILQGNKRKVNENGAARGDGKKNQ